MAKLFAADYWIVLDNVQFTRRDFQNRARLASMGSPQFRQWLTIPTHLPDGRRTLIRDAVIAESARSQRRLALLLRDHYRSSSHWPDLWQALPKLLDLFQNTDKVAHIAEASTHLLLDLLGWTGQTLHSSNLPAASGRSRRLADLAQATGACAYLCGTGGMKYLEERHFADRNIGVIPFRTPANALWQAGREISAVHFMMCFGPKAVIEILEVIAASHRSRFGPARWSTREAPAPHEAGRRRPR